MIHDSLENWDFESILDSFNRESWRPYHTANPETHQSYYRVFIQWGAIVAAIRKFLGFAQAGDTTENDGKAILSFSTGKIVAVRPWCRP